MPTSLIEAAASGRPLVAGDIPGCHPIVHPEVNGYLIPPDDAGALAQALERLVADPALRKTMGENSRRIFEEKFTIAIINKANLAVYKQLF